MPDDKEKNIMKRARKSGSKEHETMFGGAGVASSL
jgi:hypothetical protein